MRLITEIDVDNWEMIEKSQITTHKKKVMFSQSKLEGSLVITAQKIYDIHSRKCKKAAIHSCSMEMEKWKALKSPPKTRGGRVISSVQLRALDSLKIDYLGDTGCYNSMILARSLGGSRTIIVLLLDSRMATNFSLVMSALHSKPNVTTQ